MFIPHFNRRTFNDEIPSRWRTLKIFLLFFAFTERVPRYQVRDYIFIRDDREENHRGIRLWHDDADDKNDGRRNCKIPTSRAHGHDIFLLLVEARS